MTMRFHQLFLAGLMAVWFAPAEARAAILIDDSQPQFHAAVERELAAMREGKRGAVCQMLVDRLDASEATTEIRPLTSEESTWHPNDRKGTRSHVVAQDTRIRGAERSVPTGAVVYLQPARVDPKMSLYRLGTFAYQLATAFDLNSGRYSGDYKIREKRAVFFRNAWCDSLGFPVIDISDRVPTPEYKAAKDRGLLVPENVDAFPILNPD